MLIRVPGPVVDQPRVALGRCGYHIAVGYRGETAFVRRIGGHPYPRFHLYLASAASGQLAFRLHLDQKRPSYAGSHAHAAEYDGRVVEEEAHRLLSLLSKK